MPTLASVQTAYEGGNGESPSISGVDLLLYTPNDPSGRWISGGPDVVIAGPSTGPYNVKRKASPTGEPPPYSPPTIVNPHPMFVTQSPAGTGPWVIRSKRNDGTTPMVDGDPLNVPAGLSPASIRIAGQVPYPYSQLQLDIAAWSATPWCVATELYTTLEGRKIHLLRITDPSVDDATKRVMLVHCAAHPVERMSHHRVAGIAAFLCGSDPYAVQSRKDFIVYLVPNSNPDGTVHHWYRDFAKHPELTSASPAVQIGREGNRWFDGPTDVEHDGPEVYAVRSAIATIMAGSKPLQGVLDSHNSGHLPDLFQYPPGWSSLTGIGTLLATYDPTMINDRLILPDTDWSDWVGKGEITSSGYTGFPVKYPHRRLAAEYNIPSLLWEGGMCFHKNDALATPATAAAGGIAGYKAFAEWMKTH